MRYLGLDIGKKYIGVASGEVFAKELITFTAKSESSFYDNPTEALDAIQKLLIQESADAIVIGLPVDEQGQPTEESQKIRQFGEQLSGKLNTLVHYTDETLTSFMAEDMLANQGLSPEQVKARVHQLSAELILQQYLENLPKLAL